MAHLASGRSGLLLSWVLAALCLSCEGSSEMGRVELELYVRPVECTDDVCVDPDEAVVVEPAHVRSWAFVSSQTTRFYPHGRYLHFQVRNPDGAVGQVEIDAPELPALGEATATYVEYRGEERVFQATSTHGWIQLAADPPDHGCDCMDDLFDLVFVDAGADGEEGTVDDGVRRLNRARATPRQAFCTRPGVHDIEPGRLNVDVVDRCPAARRAPSPIRSGPGGPDPSPSPTGTDHGSYGDSGDSSYDSGAGCGGDSSSSGGSCSDSSSSGSGCEGDSSSSGSGCEGDSSSSGSGCEGDSSSSGSGCEGDSSGSASACEGDARGAAGPVPHRAGRRITRRAVLGGPLQLPLLVAIAFGLGRLGRRRR